MSLEELERLVTELERSDDRESFRMDMKAHLARYGLSQRETDLILQCDWDGLFDAGLTVRGLAAIGAGLGISLHEIVGSMSVVTSEMCWWLAAERNELNPLFTIFP